MESIVWSDESKFNLFGMTGDFCAKKNWRRLTAGMYTTSREIWRGKCNGVGMYGIGPITKMEGRMNGKDYIRLLSRHLLPYIMDGNAPCH